MRQVFTLWLILVSSIVLGQDLKVEQWGIFELTLPGPAAGNPFVGIEFRAIFQNDDQRFEPQGFYDGKPIIHDEINYEGDIDRRWGQLSGEEMVYRYWIATVGGAYVTHGETRKDSLGDGWISTGGQLTRESPARIAFLKDILEQGPPKGLNPIDQNTFSDKNKQVISLPGRPYMALRIKRLEPKETTSCQESSF